MQISTRDIELHKLFTVCTGTCNQIDMDQYRK